MKIKWHKGYLAQYHWCEKEGIREYQLKPGGDRIAMCLAFGGPCTIKLCERCRKEFGDD
jgi:hypothetical protein